MKTLVQKVSRKVETVFGTEITKEALVTTPQVESLTDAAEVFGSETALVDVVNFALRLLGQRQANNDLKAASSGLSEADATSVRQILRFVNQAKELGDDPKKTAEGILAKPKFAHLRPVFEGEQSGTVELDYTGFETVDGAQLPKLRAPKERDRSE
jgi:L-rhamnose isomerase